MGGLKWSLKSPRPRPDCGVSRLGGSIPAQKHALGTARNAPLPLNRPQPALAR